MFCQRISSVLRVPQLIHCRSIAVLSTNGSNAADKNNQTVPKQQLNILTQRGNGLCKQNNLYFYLTKQLTNLMKLLSYKHSFSLTYRLPWLSTTIHIMILIKILFLAILGRRAYCSEVPPPAIIPVVLYDEIKDLPNHPEKLLVDVREPNEVAETGRIPTSINIPCKWYDQLFFVDLVRRTYYFVNGSSGPGAKGLLRRNWPHHIFANVRRR